MLVKNLFVGLWCGLFLLFFWGCARQPDSVDLSPVTSVPFCQQNFSPDFPSLSRGQMDAWLRQAESDGCWEAALTAAMDAGAEIPTADLVRGLKAYNRHKDALLFHRLAERYLATLAEGKIPYAPDEARFLEAYSREAIREARSQASPQLKLAQQACWRLDRGLYARLFD